ncbi:spore coat-associated protein N [Bacillus sp. SORGH_AS 510]|uniref:CalY family protein n=1 Tax=Bacillus sp. SORGH_AS_0510 TaxID=3041771 RepID=UPI0027838348|nr:CalY family protein [Bacillus sp. SORGH_AS_0510]MDQ1145368.1 spore coat-associated protein N [Bacillus sp. SORGH_AS_0510]
MSIKKKLGLGIASAAMGLALIGGGTYAFFSDSVDTSAKFAAGTLDLNAEPTTIIDVKDIKPGDKMLRSFKLKNDGSLDISKIDLTTSYTVVDAKNNNSEDFGKHIRVNFLLNGDKADDVVWYTTLDQLKNMTPDAIAGNVFGPIFGFEKGHLLKAGTADTLYVQYEFVDNGKDQNQFQGDSLELKWTFKGYQTAGENK